MQSEFVVVFSNFPVWDKMTFLGRLIGQYLLDKWLTRLLSRVMIWDIYFLLNFKASLLVLQDFSIAQVLIEVTKDKG